MRLVILSLVIGLVAATSPRPQDYNSNTQGKPSSINFVATTPVASDLPAPFTSTEECWLDLIWRAQRSLDLAFFYASDRGPGGDLFGNPDGGATRLGEVVLALEKAAVRGVAIRIICDSGFAKIYPALLARLDGLQGASVAKFDMRSHTGGVMHAKYMIADNERAYAGSANFDWRSLDHIQELGLFVKDKVVVQTLSDVFAMDWWLASGTIPPRPQSKPKTTAPGCWHLAPGNSIAMPVVVTPVFSPKELLPDSAKWDLPLILDRIKHAKNRLWIQVMTYRMKGRDGQVFTELQDAILAAAKRGVDVRLLVADWGKRKGTIEGLQELSARGNILVRMITVPEHSSGHIPFARVIHAKFMVVDNDKSWVGSSNWERGYFYESRNVGFLLDGATANRALADFYQSNWQSPHTYEVDPEATYEVPVFGERD